MKVVIQRVKRACVRVEGREVSSISNGMLVLLGVIRGDGEAEADRLSQRTIGFRFFADQAGRMNLAAREAEAEALVVSQFTLAADGKKGRRPSFDRAADPALAAPLVERFVEHLRTAGIPTRTGVFGAEMEVELVNDGPATFILEESPRTA